MNKADEYYSAGKYEKAAKYYQKILEEDNYSYTANLQCGRSLSFIEKYTEADKYYSQALLNTKEAEPSLFLEYGDFLMKLGEPDKARSYYVSYNNLMEKSDLRVIRNINSIQNIDKFYYDSSYIHVSAMQINSYAEDYNPYIYSDKIYFESNRNYFASVPLYRDILFTEPDNQMKIRKIEGSGNEKYQGKGFSIAPYTGELIQSKHVANDSIRTYILFRSLFENSGIKTTKSDILPVDSFPFNMISPALNKSGNLLVFSSDAPGSQGGWDLYLSYRNAYGYFKPQPINGFINTMGDEVNPYLVNDTLLYFASNGQGGLGGFDIFYINLNRPASLPTNIGYPINTNFDDLGICISDDGLSGFLASNRDEQNSLSDIFSFKVDKIRAFGVVLDEHTGDNLKNVDISIRNSIQGNSELVLADNGFFSITTIPGDQFELEISKNGYKTKEFTVSTKGKGQSGLYEVNIGSFDLESEVEYVPEKIIEVEPFIQNAIEDSIEQMVEEIKIPEIILPQKGDKQFRVQIAASRVPLDNSELKEKYKGNREIFMYEEEGWYKYAIAEFSSFYEANKVRKNCGVPDAFIAAYEGSKKLQLMSAIRELYRIQPQFYEQVSKLEENRQLYKNQIVYYQTDSYEPSAEEIRKIDVLAEFLLTDQTLWIEIDGHTDIRGSADYNLGLGNERAQFLMSYLIKKGIDSNRITLLSYGETRLRKHCADKCTPEIHKANRRAEIQVYKAKVKTT